MMFDFLMQLQAILLLDIPSPAHIDPLVSSIKGSQFYKKLLKDNNGSSSASDDIELKAIYHICGDGVLEDDVYKAFMNAFRPDVNVRLFCIIFFF
jgi:ribonuclease Z